MNVEEVQRRLWDDSKAQRQHRESSTPLFPTSPHDGRARNVMDLMHNPTWLTTAALRVMKRSRNKAPGVDGVKVRDFQKGFEDKIEQLRLELKRGTYQPQSLRRVMIPKANGKMRPLGIPCLCDKIVQEAIRMALEPMFEAEFHNNSYGFRPNRSTHHAIFRCQQLMRSKFTWVIEGDVKACFDEISHKAILKVVREKVLDNKFMDLINRFLKAGVQVDGVVQPTEKGVPQGGVISPLLANAVLNKLDWFLHDQGMHGKVRARGYLAGRPDARFARYADDWCVFITRGSKRYAEGLREKIRDFLRTTCGLELSVEKTHVTHVRDGFDFLGFRLIMDTGRSGTNVPKILLGKKAIPNLKERLEDALRRRPHQESVALRVQRASAVVRGWSEYYRIAHDFPRRAGTLDHHAFWIAVKAICRKLDITTAQAVKRYGTRGRIRVGDSCELTRFSGIPMKLDYCGPEDYEPGQSATATDSELEVSFSRYNEKKRPGNMDLKHRVLERDQYCCQQCGCEVDDQDSQMDHIQPVNCFASYARASYFENLQTLCFSCHWSKHYAR
ncbi:MAG: group II intron reverse transcriptase/maturase [candidate division Zixibacteria bacterium]|nr:group II intron reverse transcriptase/maturase [candidate division Zixibacteria bacterium]